MTNGPLYPNQQLKSVSLECFFPGDFKIVSKLSEIQAAVHSELPSLFVPNVVDGKATALAPYLFKSGNGEKALAVAINQLSYISFNYPGYAQFSAAGVDAIKGALSIAGIDSLNRVVFKYENCIGMRRGNREALPVGRVFDLALPDGASPDSIRGFDFAWERNWDHGQFVGRIGIEGPPAGDTLTAVFAAVVEPAGRLSELTRLADLAHGEARRCFEQLITPDFRQELRGESEEDDE